MPPNDERRPLAEAANDDFGAESTIRKPGPAAVAPEPARCSVKLWRTGRRPYSIHVVARPDEADEAMPRLVRAALEAEAQLRRGLPREGEEAER